MRTREATGRGRRKVSVQHKGAILSAAVGAAGTTIITTLGHGHSGATVAVGVALLGAMSTAACLVCESVARHGKPASDAYEAGHQAGYDKGYLDGRRVARPVIVTLPCATKRSDALHDRTGSD